MSLVFPAIAPRGGLSCMLRVSRWPQVTTPWAVVSHPGYCGVTPEPFATELNWLHAFRSVEHIEDCRPISFRFCGGGDVKRQNTVHYCAINRNRVSRRWIGLFGSSEKRSAVPHSSLRRRRTGGCHALRAAGIGSNENAGPEFWGPDCTAWKMKDHENAISYQSRRRNTVKWLNEIKKTFILAEVQKKYRHKIIIAQNCYAYSST